MSEFTRHKLSWDTGDEPTENKVALQLAELIKADVNVASEIAFQWKPAAWCNSQEHISQISRQWPKTVFSLDCNGEQGDRWITFFRDGTCYSVVYSKPEFDDRLLRRPAGATATS